jgi:teichuronic acid biosynthesis glycosyltransferase TuaG
MPEISVVMPAFNAENTVLQAIESVQAQAFRDWELLVVDDHSSDGTAERVRRVARLDSRVKLSVLERNSGGPARPRNVGIDGSSGSFIAFLDADDWWAPEKLSRQLDFMKREGAVLSSTGYDVVGVDGQPAGSFMPPPVTTHERLLRASTIGCLTAMVDARALGKLQFPLCGHEDYALWLGILRSGRVAHGLQERLATYRQRGGSISANKLKVLSFYFHIYRKLEGFSTIRSGLMCLRCAWANRNKYGG